jgi:predicted kinase
MARLILLNGPPGSGKSTLAARYAADHPLTLALDIDDLRRMLGGWLERLPEAGLLARRMAVELARLQLREGRDVVVPQFLGRPDFIDALAELCATEGAEFVEIVLRSAVGDDEARFQRRVADPQTPAHNDAAALYERAGSTFPQMYRAMLEVMGGRPATLTIWTVEGDVDGAYRNLLAAVGAHR